MSSFICFGGAAALPFFLQSLAKSPVCWIHSGTRRSSVEKWRVWIGGRRLACCTHAGVRRHSGELMMNLLMYCLSHTHTQMNSHEHPHMVQRDGSTLELCHTDDDDDDDVQTDSEWVCMRCYTAGTMFHRQGNILAKTRWCERHLDASETRREP